jgi:hypothetical protein
MITVYIPVKAIIIFILIIMVTLFLMAIPLFLDVVNKIREDRDACKKEKESQDSQNCKENY